MSLEVESHIRGSGWEPRYAQSAAEALSLEEENGFLVGRAIHQHSSRAPGPFVAVNCKAKELDVSRMTLYRLAAKHGITRDKA